MVREEMVRDERIGNKRGDVKRREDKRRVYLSWPERRDFDPISAWVALKAETKYAGSSRSGTTSPI